MFEFHDFNSSTGFLAVVYTPTFTLMYAVHVRVYTQTYAWTAANTHVFLATHTLIP